MNLHKLYSIFFLPLIVSLLTMVVVTGCSDDGDEVLQSQYGYVQFKLYKSTSFEKGTTTRATDKLETLSSAQKIKVVMMHNGTHRFTDCTLERIQCEQCGIWSA